MRRFRAVTTVVTSAAMVVALAAIVAPPPAAAAPPDPGVQQLATFLTGASNSLQSWSSGLGQLGKLADALPAVQTSPGSALGFDDLLSKAFSTGTKSIPGALNDGDLAIDEDLPLLGSGRTGHLTTSLTTVGADKHLSVHVTASRQLTSQPLTVNVPIGAGTNAPQSAFSSTGGVQLTVSADLRFDLVWDGASNTVYLTVDNTAGTPKLAVDASASFSDKSAVKASIGILGVGLVNDGTSNLALSAHFVATVSDPNNDGRLAFENTDHSAGELAKAGSLAGLVSFGFASPAGTVHADLHLQVAAATTFASLPAVDATITVDWPNIAVGTPTVTTSGLPSVGDFLNMTPRDLALGIAQLVTSLTSIQRAKANGQPSFGNLNLPFLRGTLADAIQLNEKLKDFLSQFTFPASTDPNFVPGVDDPAKAGQPKFVSVQQFFDGLGQVLSSSGGGIGNIGFDAVTHKLAFTLSLNKDAPAQPVALDGAAAASTGPASSPGNPANTTYGATSLTDPNQTWTPGEFAGRHVTAGNSGATITGNTATALTLDSNGWTGGVPNTNDPYAISGTSGDIGTVSLGNALQTPDATQGQPGHGVANANAVNATAKVKPSYHASITLVLDLSAPVVHDPPIEQHNADGSTVLVSSTPLGADRVLLRTSGAPLFTADFPIDAGVDMYAKAGFLQARLTGALHVCQSGQAADCSGSPAAGAHMLTVSLKNLGDITFGTLITKLLADPTQVLDFSVKVRAAGAVTASIPGASSFFSGGDPSVGFHWNDLTQLDPNNADGPKVDFSALSQLAAVDFDPSNPRALFSIILKTLQTLDTALGNQAPGGAAAAIFSTKIPVVGRTLGDLLKSDESGIGAGITYGANSLSDAGRSAGAGNAFPSSLVGRTVVVGTQVGIVSTVTDNTLTMASNWGTQPADGTAYTARSELDDVISILEQSPSDTMQSLVDLLNKRLGHSVPITFAYENDAKVGNKASLVIKLDWKRSFHTSAPVSFDFSLPIGDQKLAGVQGAGSVSVGAQGEVKLGLVVPLAPGTGPDDPTALKILDDSNINLGVDATVSNGSLATTIGPLSLSLGNPKSAAAADKAVADASYSVGIGKPGGDGTATSFSDFLGAVSPIVNGSSRSVTCNGLAGATALSLCAQLPLFVSTDGGNTYTKLITDPSKSNQFALRLPKQPQGGAGLTDILDPTGGAIDTHPRLETPDAAALGDAIKQHLIDLTRIDGIDSFLNLLQTSLQTASFGGKLPLVGDDLQQGADFIGSLKKTIDGVLGDLASKTSIAGVRDWVNGKLKTALTSAGLNPDTVQVDTQCSDTLGSAGQPTVTMPSGTAAGKTYTYAIAAYITNSNNDKLEAKPGPVGSITNGPAFKADGVSPSATLHVSWAAVTGAIGYRVFRRDGGALKLVGDVTGVTFDDAGTATPGAAPQNPATNPRFTDCDLSHFDSVLIRLNVSQGDFSGDNLSCDGLADPHKCITKTVPLNIGIPGLSLRAATPGDGPQVQLGWRLHLAFGISRSDGFFVDTKDGDPQPEFAVGLNFALPSEVSAQLAFINVGVSNCVKSDTTDCDSSAPATAQPLFGGSFKINITSPHADGRLTLGDLSSATLSSLFDVKLHAGVNIDWLLKAHAAGDLGAGFPGIQAELQLKWAWDNASPGSNGGASPLTIAFQKVQLDVGDVFGKILGPIIKQIKTVTGPLDPIIKTLYAPIPVLSDLSHLVGGDDITLVSIAKAFSTLAGGPDLTLVDRVLKIIQLVNHLPDGDHILIPIGSFTLSGGSALANTATPDNTGSLISSKALDPGASGSSGVLGSLDSHDGNGQHILNGGGGGANAPAAKAGFSFPVFEHPSSLFNLLLGGDVDLVQFDSGPLTLAFDWRQEFGPVYAPPPVLITLHGSASVTMRIVAGFDTFGIRKAVEAVRDGSFSAATVGESILQSLYFKTTDDQGNPIPVVQFTGELAAGAAVSAVIIEVGVEGGVGLTVSFLWNDPNHDGKFRISEFLTTALNNPLCLFSVSGRVFVFLKLFVKIGFGPFSVSFSFTIVDVTLLDFSATPNCQPPPPKLAGLSSDGTTLVVYAGKYGHTTQRGNSAWDNGSQDNETVKITSLHDYTDPAHPTFTGVAVDLLGIRRSYLNSSIQRVVVDGRGYGKPMNVTFIGDAQQTTTGTGSAPPTAQFDRDAVVFGGDGNDNIKTGIGNSWVDGGKGNDTIVTGDRTVLTADGTSYLQNGAKARVAGGPGDDNITVGNGADVVSGDGSLGAPPTVHFDLTDLKNDGRDSGDPLASGQGEGGSSVDVPNASSLPDPSGAENSGTDGNDVVSAGLGASTLYGNAGRDTLSVAPDNPLVSAHPDRAALFTSPGVTLVGGTGDDTLSGGTGPDTITTGPTAGGLDTNPDAVGGADDGSTNVVDTGTGNDKVFGSTGTDRVTGHSTPVQVDDVRGGAGNDILLGGYGKDTVFGGPGDDYVIAEPSTVDLGSGAPPADGPFGPLYTVTHQPLPSGTSPSSKTLVGGTGNDHIIGGDGGAAIDGDGYNQTARCAAGNPVASDAVDESVNTAQDGNDKIIGGNGVDNVRAGGGDDLVTAAAGDDLVCGESGSDALHGGDGQDQLWGGTSADSEFGDTGADSVYGNDGNDALYGNDGADLIEGNNGADFASGGADNDVVLGGTQKAGRPDTGDVLNGDTGDDVIIGDNGGLVSSVWTPFDLDGATPTAGGADVIFGGDGTDRGFGGLSNDVLHGGTGTDHLEGNNADDTIYGDDGEDELVGGGGQSAASGIGFPDGVDTVFGGNSADVITGDNAVVTTVAASAGADTVKGRQFSAGHAVTLLDLGYTPTAGTSAGDVLHGEAGTDVIYGQGGNDQITGDADDDYAEGGPGADTISGGTGEDDLVGGSSTPCSCGAGVGQPDTGDTISGNENGDVVIGDNGAVLRVGTPNPLTDRLGMATKRAITLLDLGTAPHDASSGADVITGDQGTDVVFGQGGDDRLKGNDDDDYLEGDQGSDWVEGDQGNDDLVGGSSTPQSGSGAATVGQLDTADALYGGPGDDAAIGDNALLLRTGARSRTFNRIATVGGLLVPSRNLTLFDLGTAPLVTPPAGQFGDDRISGGAGVDVLYGQDGADQMSGGAGDDYLEGNGGTDVLRGDRLLSEAPTTVGEAPTAPLAGSWPGTASAASDLEGTGADGQDDLIGGSSLAGFRDAGDSIEGDDKSDFELGDNGVLQRVIQGSAPSLTEKVFVQRYSETSPLPADAARVRVGDVSVVPNGSTRFCTTAQATCEPAGASGSDLMFGDGGDDTQWGQDGNDTMHGGAGNDDMYGELGDDVMFGEDGADGMLGDRGGIVDELINPSDAAKSFTVDTGGVPKESYTAFRPATYDHRVDLLHDINGDAFVGASTSAAMAHAGLTEGGTDRIRGGNGPDDIHAGFGDDLANGDSGGDAVFGDDGADVLWGGRGCDPAVDTAAVSPDCYTSGTFDASARGTNDRMIDHLYGGAGGTSPTSLGKKGDVGADVLDWQPRGTYTPGTGCTANPFPEDLTSSTIDPCAWFEMTGKDTVTTADDQHHQGTDWMYGGWDRDVMQGDVTQNGPNPGDRMIDWNGAYNLFSGCNAAYGGYNDIRQHSPAMQAFLQGVSYADGAGQIRSDTSTAGTSGFVELALAYPGKDNDHAAGSAFPTTPGHFDTNACS